MNDGTIRKLDTLPAVVAVHCVVAAHQSCNLPDAEFANFLLQLPDEIAAAVRRCVAPVHEAVDKNILDFLLLGHFQQRKQVLDVRVHSAVAEQSHQMQLALPSAFHRLLEKRHILQLLVGNK